MNSLHVCTSLQTQLMYMLFNTPTRLISKRETLTLINWYVEQDGTLYMVASSVEDPLVPPTKGKTMAVRWHVLVGSLSALTAFS